MTDNVCSASKGIEEKDYEFKLDYVLSTVFALVGIYRMARDIHQAIGRLAARLLTLKIANFHEKP